VRGRRRSPTTSETSRASHKAHRMTILGQDVDFLRSLLKESRLAIACRFSNVADVARETIRETANFRRRLRARETVACICRPIGSISSWIYESFSNESREEPGRSAGGGSFLKRSRKRGATSASRTTRFQTSVRRSLREDLHWQSRPADQDD